MTKTKTPTPEQAKATDTFALVDLALLVPDPGNVRDEITDVDDLAASIYQLGLQQPLRVRFVPHGFIEADPTCAVYVVVAGHRRLAALRQLNDQGLWTGEVPCMIAPESITDDDITAAMLVENLQRADLNPIEEGKAFHRLTKEFGYKQADLAAKIGRSASYVSDRMALLRLPEKVVDAVRDTFIPLKIGVALSKVGDDETVNKLTKGGRVVPTEETITRAIETLKYEKVKASFAPAIEATGLKVADGDDRFGSAYKTDVLATCSTPADLEREAALAPRNALLFVEDRPYSGSFHVEIRRKLTEKQIAKAEETRKAEQMAKQDAWQQEQQARFEAERASWTDEYRAWVDICEEIRRHNQAEEAEHRAAVEAVTAQYVANADAKKVSRFALLHLIDHLTDDWHSATDVAARLGLTVPDDDDAYDVLTAHALSGAQQLVSVALASLVEWASCIPDHRVNEDLAQYIRKANVPAPDLRQFPAEPPKTAGAAAAEHTDEPDDDFNQEDPDAADDFAA